MIFSMRSFPSLFLGVSVSCALFACAQPGPNAAGGEAAATREAETLSPEVLESPVQTQNQPSLPGGVVNMGVDPHGLDKFEGGAQASILCEDAGAGTVRIRLSGQLKNVEEGKLAKGDSYLRLMNNRRELMDLVLSDEYRFEQTLEAHRPLRFEFWTWTKGTEPGALNTLFYGRSTSDGVFSMAICPPAGCSWYGNTTMTIEFGEEPAEGVPSCGAEPAAAGDAQTGTQAAVRYLCRDNAKGTVRIRLKGRIPNLSEEEFPKGQTYIRLNNNGTQILDIPLDANYAFDVAFEARLPLLFGYKAWVPTPTSRIYSGEYANTPPLPGEIPTMSPSIGVAGRTNGTPIALVAGEGESAETAAECPTSP